MPPGELYVDGGRERVAVALTGGTEGETLIRRAARIAARSSGAELLAVHVVRNDGLADANPANLARQRVLVESLGGTYHQVLGNDIATTLLTFARGVHATQLVLGAGRRGRIAKLFAPGVGATTAARSGSIDVHLVTHEEVSRDRARPAWGRGLTRRRRILGLATAVVGLPALTYALSLVRAELTFPGDVLLFLAAVVGIALLGGLYPALVAAVGGFLLLNYYFTPPLHELTVDRPENVLALVVFLIVGTAVSVVVELAARRTAEASSARAEAATLSTVAGSVLRGGHPLTALLEQLRETFGLTNVTLLEKHDQSWRIASAVGDQPATSPADGDSVVPIGDEILLVLVGRRLGVADRRVLDAFAAQAALALRQQRLAAQAATADKISAADRLRSALLSAVSHDLRTPLASAKAAVTSLRSPDVAFGPADREELLATADESLDRLIGLVENLLDMSRLQAGVLGVHTQPISVADVLPRVIDDAGVGEVTVRVPDDLPEVRADPALLERILVNVLANAVRFSPPGRPPTIKAHESGDEVEVHVIDHGPGIPAEAREVVFQPFQRLGDRDSGTGVGLGLALSRGLAEAMGGTLQPETTAGGGLTMVLRLPAAPS
jgi:two-component system sensor histidine kinase KdpD